MKKVSRFGAYLLVAVKLMGAGMEGQVIDAITGKGIPGVQVRGQSRGARVSGPGEPVETVTDATGKFSFATPATGLRYEREGYRALQAPGEIEMDEARSAAGVTKLLLPLSVLQGAVLDERQKPIAHAQIVAAPSGGNQEAGKRSSVRTDESGKFQIQVDPWDTLLTIADPRCGARDLLPGTPPRRRGFLEETIRLNPGETRRITRTLAPLPTYSISGQLENQIPPFPQATLQMSVGPRLEPGPNYFCLGMTQSRHFATAGGAFLFDGLSSGKYRIQLSLYPLSQGDVGSAGPRFEMQTDLDIKGRDQTGLRLVLGGAPRIEGKVVWEGASPAPDGVSIAIQSEGGRRQINQAPKAEPALLQFDAVQPGRYKVSIEDRAKQTYLKEVRWNGIVAPTRWIELPPDLGNPYLEVIAATGAARLQVKVSGDGPVSVVLFQSRADGIEIADRSGAAPGDYLLLAIEPALPRRLITADLLRRMIDSARPVTLAAGETRQIEIKGTRRDDSLR